MSLNSLAQGQGRVNSFEMFREVKYRRVTRLQLEVLRVKFDFLELPGEIRNLVYKIVLAMGFEAIQHFFDKSYARISAPGLTDKERVISKDQIKRSTPAMFLVNKQIYREAHGLLAESSVVFHHGMLTVSKISRIISPNVLRMVQDIEINDHGHPIVKKLILGQSWNGYTRLIKQLAGLLSKGDHNLKTFTINFTDPELTQHMTTCAFGGYKCGFRDQMRDALNLLRRVRGIGNVVLKGLNPQQSAELKAIMEAPPKTFYDLPREIRDIVYDFSLDWSDISSSITLAVGKSPGRTKLFPGYKIPTRSTPTILLLNNKTTSEALEVLHKKPLKLTLPAGINLLDVASVPAFTKFISANTLSKVCELNITVESWKWLDGLDKKFLTHLTGLEVFKLHVTDDKKDLMLKSPIDGYPDKQMHKYLSALTTLRDLKVVEITGDLPEDYSKALASAMTGNRSMGAVPGLGLWRFPTIEHKVEEDLAHE